MYMSSSASVPTRTLEEKMVVDKIHLAKTIQLLNKEEDFHFAHGAQVENIDLKMCQVEELGNMQIPVSLEDFKRLKQIASVVPYGKGENKSFDSLVNVLQICPLKILATTPECLDLSALILLQLGLPSYSINVEAKLDKLVLYESDCGFYNQDFDYKKTHGQFGTAFLQLPVEGGHDGGCLKAEYRGNKKMFETHVNSHQQFYLSAFYGNCTYLMEPITRGWKMALVFRLVWTNAIINAPYDFPIFLSALKEMEHALLPWIPLPRVDPKTGNSVDVPIEVDEFGSASTHRGAPDTSSKTASAECGGDNSDDCSETYDLFCLDDATLKEDIIYFVLKEKYDGNDLSFHHLRGEDRNLAHLLLSCQFLDVHLALVTLKSLNEEHNGWSRCSREMLSTKISRWVDSNNVIRDLSVQLNWQKQRVGPIRKLLTQRGMKPDREKRILHKAQEDWEKEDQVEEEIDEDQNIDRIQSDLELLELVLSSASREEEEEKDFVVRTQYFDHFVLVVWPRHQSFHLYSRYGLHSLLDNIENALNSASPEEKEVVRQEVKRDFQKIVSFCCAEPNKAWSSWNEQDEKRNGLTCRLIRLCTVLQAREEGIAILKMIVRNMSLIGTKDEEVARAIADFECQVAGWDSCIDLIKVLISRNRVISRFSLLSKLAQCFLDVNCFEGAKMVADGISSSLVTAGQSKNADFRYFDVELYTNLIISLESVAETSNQERITSFAAYFPSLGSSVLCQLLLKLEQSSSPLKALDSYKFLLCELYKAIPTCQLACSDHFWSIKRIIVQLVQCYILLGNAELIRSLISKICEPADSSEYAKKFQLSREIMSSSEFWEFANLPELKQSSSCFECYRDACRLLFTKDFVSIVKSSGNLAVLMVNCLLFLNDETCWQSFAQRMCASFATKKNDIFVRIFLTNFEFQLALLNSTSANASFNHIMDHWTEQWKSYEEPRFSWQRKANVGNPEIDAFLRSHEQESMTYVKEENINDVRWIARCFKKKGLKNGFTVVIKSKRNKKKPRCVITKDRSYHVSIVQDFQNRKSDFEKLVKLHQSVRDNLGKRTETSRSEIEMMAETCIGSSAKRVKHDFQE